MSRGNILSIVCVLLYGVFWLWYSWGGALSPEEVEHYVGLYAEGGSDPESLARLRAFLENDTGDDFVMLNVIELQEPPLAVAGVEPGETANDVLGKYMEYMWPALLKRACHPVLAGSAAAPALDTWGIEGALHWSTGAGMRYRSRRDMLEIATNPAFSSRHEFKTASMAKTIAFPIDPWFQLGDPRLVLGLLLVILLLTLRLFARPRPSGPILPGHLR